MFISPKPCSPVTEWCYDAGVGIFIQVAQSEPLSKNGLILTGEFKTMATVACTKW